MVNSFFRSIMQKKEAQLMLQLGGDVKGGKVLEIGCGRGVGVEYIFDIFGPSHVEAFEFDPYELHLAEKRLLPKYKDKIKLYEASATKIPSPDNSFDAVFDFGVLHHIPDNSAAISEIARVLKPNGRFFFMELLSSFTNKALMRLLAPHPHEAQFNEEEFLEKLANARLMISENSYIKTSKNIIGIAHKKP